MGLPILILCFTDFYKRNYHRIVEKYNVLEDYQHGFQQGKSTITTEDNFVESTKNSIDKSVVFSWPKYPGLVIVCLICC